jgi:hypothetical protein
VIYGITVKQAKKRGGWGGGRTITPAMLLRKTEYAERYDVKLLLLFKRFHGSMHRPTMAAI